MPVETKMIIMLERINDSRRAMRVSKNSPNSKKVDLLTKIRHNFKSFYPEDEVED